MRDLISIHERMLGLLEKQIRKCITTKSIITIPIPQALFTNVNMDFIEGLPRSNDNEVIFMVAYRFNKYSHFISLSHSYSATIVSIAFIDHVYKLHGLPTTIMSDKNLSSKVNFGRISLPIKEQIYTIL